MPPLPDLQTPLVGKLMQKERSIATDQVSAKPSSVILSTGIPCPTPWKNGRSPCERKCPKSRNSRVLDLSGLAGIKHHVTGTHTRIRVSALTRTHRTVSTSQWTSMPPMSLHVMTLRGQTVARRVPVSICGTRGQGQWFTRSMTRP
jgi:hypothetical protein